MRRVIAITALIAVVAVPLGAQGRGRGRNGNGMPPGHQPRPGECRVWYDGVPPGRQPAPTSCRQAERIAARDSRARVIYGSDRDRYGTYRDDDYRRRDRGDRDRYGYPDRTQNRRGGYGQDSVAFDNGSRDGYVKGQEDARKNRSWDPVRHDWYQSANRGYNSRYGTREEYRDAYRAGFRSGYEDGYRDRGNGRDGGIIRWPF